MTDIIPINYENPERPTVSGRELYAFLDVNTPYKQWFDRMAEYGFAEGKDYCTILCDRSDGLAGKPRTDHQLTIPMAKEIAMIQRNERGNILSRLKSNGILLMRLCNVRFLSQMLA